jgi:uncharacterized protein YraI
METTSMNKILATTALALLTATVMTGPAAAQFAASATAELNVRVGPGPQYQAIGVIPAGGTVSVLGCMEASKWCQITYENTNGWAYSDYLAGTVSGQAVVMTERRPDMAVPVATYDAGSGGAASGAAVGATSGVIIGALVGGPIGAVVGGMIGASAGATAGAVIDPPETAIAYVRSNPTETVYLDGEVVVGAAVPETVSLAPIPDYSYQYVWVNGQAALIDPASRQIVYVVR